MAKRTKRNIAKGKNKKKRQARREREKERLASMDQDVLAKQQEREAAEKEKAKAKAIEDKKKEKEKRENPGIWTRSVDFIKSTYQELKKTQWLDAAQLNKATGSVFGIVTVFTALTWVVDSGLGALTAFILGL